MFVRGAGCTGGTAAADSRRPAFATRPSEIFSTDSRITGKLASYVGDSRLRRAPSTFWRPARPRKAKPATRAGFISVLIFRWFGDHRKLSESFNSQLPENQAACQAETSFPLTGELCADFTALSDGRVEPQPERRSYVYNDRFVAEPYVSEPHHRRAPDHAYDADGPRPRRQFCRIAGGQRQAAALAGGVSGGRALSRLAGARLQAGVVAGEADDAVRLGGRLAADRLAIGAAPAGISCACRPRG